MVVADIMTTTVVTVEMDDSLETIQAIFQRVRFHHILVVNDNKLVGVISDRDLLKAISPFVGTPSERERDANTLNKRAHQIMSRHPVTIYPHESVEKAITTILEKQVTCLPIISGQCHIEGILTWRDILSYLSSEKHDD